MAKIRFSLQDFLISRFGLGIGVVLSRLPERAGLPLAHWLADLLSKRKNNPSVRAVKANQWVVHNYKISGPELDLLVKKTYRNTARSLYEFWHSLGHRHRIKNLVEFEPSFMKCVKFTQENKTGLIMVVAHLSNFDLIGQAAALNGIPLHILSYPSPPGGYRWQNEIRKQPNLTVTPISIQALRLASETLKNGGLVATGIDRPLPGDEHKYPVKFFNRPAFLPVFHIRLALKHNVPVAVVGGCRQQNGVYSVWASDMMYMQANPDLVKETVTNAEALLEITSRNIQRAPDQWAMFYPVWPETLDQVPT